MAPRSFAQTRKSGPASTLEWINLEIQARGPALRSKIAFSVVPPNVVGPSLSARVRITRILANGSLAPRASFDRTVSGKREPGLRRYQFEFAPGLATGSYLIVAALPDGSRHLGIVQVRPAVPGQQGPTVVYTPLTSISQTDRNLVALAQRRVRPGDPIHLDAVTQQSVEIDSNHLNLTVRFELRQIGGSDGWSAPQSGLLLVRTNHHPFTFYATRSSYSNTTPLSPGTYRLSATRVAYEPNSSPVTVTVDIEVQ